MVSEKRAPAAANRRPTHEKNRSSRHFRGAGIRSLILTIPSNRRRHIPAALRFAAVHAPTNHLCLLIFARTLLRCIRFAFSFDWFCNPLGRERGMVVRQTCTNIFQANALPIPTGYSPLLPLHVYLLCEATVNRR